VNIISNPASQRTSSICNISVLLNFEYENKNYILYNSDDGVYLSSMNQDGTNWIEEKISSSLAFLSGDNMCQLHNGVIYLTNSPESILRYSIDNGLLQDDLGSGGSWHINFDFSSSKIYYDSGIYSSVTIKSTNLDGSSLTTNTANIGSSFAVVGYNYTSVKCDNKLLFSWIHSSTEILRFASCELDGSNVAIITYTDIITMRPIKLIYDGLNVQMFLIDLNTIYPIYGRCSSSGSGFTSTLKYNNGIGVIEFNLYNSLLYYTLSEIIGTSTRITIQSCGLNGSGCTDLEYLDINSDFVSDTRVYSNSENIYAWIQPDENGIDQLWTYPGDYIEPVEPVEPVLPLPSPHPWPMVGQNYSNTYASPYQFSNKLSEKWRTQLDDYILSLLISENNIMYACLYNGKVVSLTSEGNINWTYETNDPTLRIPVRAGIIGANNNIYVSSDDGNITALNTSGELIWKVLLDNVTNGFIGGFTNNNGTLYFVESNKLHSFDYDGNVKWTFNAYTDSLSILDNNGTIYINDYVYNTLYALNYDGSVKWQKVGLGQTYSLLVAPNGNIYFMQYNYNSGNSLIVLNPTDGNEIWRYALNNNGISYSTAIDYNNYYYFTYNDLLGTGFIIIDSNGIELFNSRQLNNQIIYYYMNKILLDSNGTVYISGYNSTNVVIITYNLYTSIYEINIVNDYFDANGFSMNNGNNLYAYCSDGKIISFEKYTPILPQVQCRATQIIVSANTGKIILSVPIL